MPDGPYNGMGGGPFMLFAGLLPNLITLAVVALVVFAAWRWQRTRRSLPTDTTLMPSADANRLVLASLVLKGAFFRRQVLNQLRNPFRAQAVEPGLNMPLVLAAARRLEVEERVYQWALAALTLAVLLLPGLLRWLALIVLIGTALFVKWRQRFVLATGFRRDVYSAEAMLPRYGLKASNPVDEAAAPVFVSATSDPFVGLGQNVNSWNLALDVTRSAPDRETTSESVSAAALEQDLARGLSRLALANMSVREGLFVSGVETLRTPGVQADPMTRPVRTAAEASLKLFRNVADPRARAYQVAQIKDWDGEIVVSYLFRCVLRGSMLSLETVALALGPIARSYREIDALEVLDWFALLRWGVVSLATIPFLIIGSFMSVIAQISEALDAGLGGEEGRQRKQIKANPAYNYGAKWSLREHIADKSTSSWFQKSDIVQYLSALDAQILNTFKDRLASAGVDTSTFAQQAGVIQNTTVMVSQGGQISGMVVGSSNKVAVAAPAGAR